MPLLELTTLLAMLRRRRRWQRGVSAAQDQAGGGRQGKTHEGDCRPTPWSRTILCDRFTLAGTAASLTLCALSVHLGVLALSSPVGAAGGDPANWDRPPPRAVDGTLPPANRGFQAALRSGLQLPWG